LSCNDTTEIQVPAFIIVPAGQTSVVFAVTIIDDTEIDGPQSATVTAQVINWTSGSATIRVLDNESTNLLVSVHPHANEAAGVIANGGSITISGTLTTNLTVSLNSSDPARLTVPDSIVIPAGETTANFDLTLIDNSIIDGSEVVTVSAQAPFFGPAGAMITIY